MGKPEKKLLRGSIAIMVGVWLLLTEWIYWGRSDLQSIGWEVQMLLATAVTASGGGVLWWSFYWLNGRVIEPLQQITRMVQSVQQGVYDSKAPESFADTSLLWELDRLMGNFLSMQTILKQHAQAWQRYKLLADRTQDIILFVDEETGRILEANQSAVLHYGYSEEALRGKTVYDISDPSVHWKIPQQIRIARTKGVVFETLHRRKDGIAFPVEVSASSADLEGRPVLLGIVRDISDRKYMEHQLTYISYHDKLTGLFNRHYFEQELYKVAESEGAHFGVMVVDVDGLKLVNDYLGHSAGDRLLVGVAHVLRASVRLEDMVARIGGDEFAVLLRGGSEEEGEQVEGRIRRMAQIYAGDEENLPLCISVGSAWYVGDDPQEVFRRADDRMYADKHNHHEHSIAFVRAYIDQRLGLESTEHDSVDPV